MHDGSTLVHRLVAGGQDIVRESPILSDGAGFTEKALPEPCGHQRLDHPKPDRPIEPPGSNIPCHRQLRASEEIEGQNEPDMEHAGQQPAESVQYTDFPRYHANPLVPERTCDGQKRPPAPRDCLNRWSQ